MKIFFLLSGLTLLLLPSCAIKRTITVDQLKPAKNTFPAYEYVATTNRSLLDSASFYKVYPPNLLTSKFREIPNFIGNDVLNSFYDEMQGLQRIRLSEIKPLPTTYRTQYIPSALDTQVLANIHAENPALQAILVLEGVKYEIYTYGNVYKDQLLLSNGKYLDIPVFNSNHSYRILTFWRMYDLASRKVVMEKDFSEEMPFYYDGYSRQDGKGYGENEQGWQRAASYTGKAFAKTFLPTWQTVEREIFQGESQVLLSTADLAELGKWLEAAEKWEIYLHKNKPGKREKARIYYNLSVAYEVLDMLAYARELCEKAYELTQNGKYLDRAAQLKIREKEVELLNKQFYGK